MPCKQLPLLVLSPGTKRRFSLTKRANECQGEMHALGSGTHPWDREPDLLPAPPAFVGKQQRGPGVPCSAPTAHPLGATAYNTPTRDTGHMRGTSRALTLNTDAPDELCRKEEASLLVCGARLPPRSPRSALAEDELGKTAAATPGHCSTLFPGSRPRRHGGLNVSRFLFLRTRGCRAAPCRSSAPPRGCPALGAVSDPASGRVA